MQRRRFLTALGGGLITTTLTGGCTTLGEALRVAVSPWSSESVYAAIKPDGDGLDSRDIQFEQMSNWREWTRALQDGAVAAAETPWTPYALGAVARNDAEVLFERKSNTGDWRYASQLLVRQESEIETVADLEGESVGLGVEFSLAAMLYPLSRLEAAGVDIGGLPWEDGANAAFDPRKWGGYYGETALDWLHDGDVTAAGTADLLTECPNGPTLDGLRVLDTTGAIPHGPILAATAAADARDDVRAFFETLDPAAFDGLWFDSVRQPTTDTTAIRSETDDLIDWSTVRETVWTPDNQGPTGTPPQTSPLPGGGLAASGDGRLESLCP